MQVAIVCSSRLLGRFRVTVQLQASLTSLCLTGWVGLCSTASAAITFYVEGVLGTFPGHAASRAHWSQKLAAGADPTSKGKGKDHMFPCASILKTQPRNPCVVEGPVF